MFKIKPIITIRNMNGDSRFHISVAGIDYYFVNIGKECGKYKAFQSSEGSYEITAVNETTESNLHDKIVLKSVKGGCLPFPQDENSAHVYIREVFRAIIRVTDANSLTKSRSAIRKQIAVVAHQAISCTDELFKMPNQVKSSFQEWYELSNLAWKLHTLLGKESLTSHLELPYLTYLGVIAVIRETLCPMSKENNPERIKQLTEIGLHIDSSKSTVATPISVTQLNGKGVTVGAYLEPIMKGEAQKTLPLSKLWEMVPKAGIKAIVITDGESDAQIKLVNPKNQTVTATSKVILSADNELSLKKLQDASVIREVKNKIEATAQQLGVSVDQLIELMKK